MITMKLTSLDLENVMAFMLLYPNSYVVALRKKEKKQLFLRKVKICLEMN